MDELRETIIINDNKLTDDLRNRITKEIEKVRNIPIEERRHYYKELIELLEKILENKNKNFDDIVKKIKEKDTIISIQIVSICDYETEKFIREIFKILKGDLEEK